MAEKKETKKPSYSTIILHSNGEDGEKYLVLEVTDDKTKAQTFWIVSAALPYHSGIRRMFLEKYAKEHETVDSHGGGILAVNKGQKTIRTFGSSGGYGPPNRAMVEEILKNSAGLQGFKLDVTVTDYIRD